VAAQCKQKNNIFSPDDESVRDKGYGLDCSLPDLAGPAEQAGRYL
jgi:hypothetical protein